MLEYRLHNIGANNPGALLKYIELIEEFLGRTTKKRSLPVQHLDRFFGRASPAQTESFG